MLLMLLLVSSCADLTVLQSLGRTTRAIETQHRARLGNHTKQSIHKQQQILQTIKMDIIRPKFPTKLLCIVYYGALMARVHKLLQIPIFLFLLGYFLKHCYSATIARVDTPIIKH
ncbi:unnamed protein product [Sphagnum balticum]